jgi:hypothetical protein
METIGAAFFILIPLLVFLFVRNKHKNIVDIKPSTDLAILQRQKVVEASAELNPVIVIGKPVSGVSFNR